MTAEAYIYDAIRTPRGKGKKDGSLYEVRPIELLVTMFKALRARHDLDTRQVDDVVLGCVTPIGDQGADIGRFAVLHADWAVDVPGLQINRFCASGLEAVNLAAMKVRSGWEELIVAGGVESMSRIPMASDGGPGFFDPAVNLKGGFVPQGISADLIATLAGLSRPEVDAFAARSQRLATHARANGYFTSIIPVLDQNGITLLDHDEHIRLDSTVEGLAALKPAFQTLGELVCDAVILQQYPELERINHVHTAGNSSGIVDGAALVLVGSRARGESLGLRPRARVVAGAVVGADPTTMLLGPAPASRKALEMAGMTLKDIDLIEVNEAFAAVPICFLAEMGWDTLDNVNVNGGAIALGHPLGATGAMLLGAALDELERRGKATALITLCVGAGMGIATIIEWV